MPRKGLGWLWWAAGIAAVAALAGGAATGVVALTEAQRIAQLEPETRRRYLELAKRMKALGLPIWAGSTYRSIAVQRVLQAAGKSTVTIGWHNLRRAVDAYPLLDGKPDTKGVRVEAFRTMAAEAQPLGFRSLAFNADGSKRYITTAKGKVWDAGHLEYRGDFATLAAAVADAKQRGALA